MLEHGTETRLSTARPASGPGLASLLTRRAGPRLLAASAHATTPARFRAAATRKHGGRGSLELFFAFDDPCSAVALTELQTRLAGRRVDIELLPVARRGMTGDPAVAQKRAYAIVDAGRLARNRLGRELARESPLAPERVAFLAEWVAGAPQGPALGAFCRDALARLWFDEAATSVATTAELERLWGEHLGDTPTADPSALRRNEARMSRRGPYETPAAWAAGRWYFAHDRPAQICEWLDTLGWTERSA